MLVRQKKCKAKNKNKKTTTKARGREKMSEVTIQKKKKEKKTKNIFGFIKIDRYTLKRAKNAFRECKQSLKYTYRTNVEF